MYFAVNAMTDNKSDVIITVTEYELNVNLMSNVGGIMVALTEIVAQPSRDK